MDTLQDFSAGGASNSANHEEDHAIDAPLVIGTDERRMHVRAYNYWVSLLKGRAYPAVEDLDVDDMYDFGPQSVLLDFTEKPESPAIAWLGARLRAECGLADGVETIGDVPSRSLLSRLTDHHLQIIANRAPIGFEAEFVNTRGNNTMYRGILLPFSSDNDTIDFIYGVINWKEIADVSVQADLAHAVAPARARLPARPVVPVWADGPSGAARSALLATSAARIDVARDEHEADDATEVDDTAERLPSDALIDRLRAARETAVAALGADMRSRSALYIALNGAYDFALIAEQRGDEYVQLLADQKISSQARAPMTPVAKLIFGREYDKTRLTEFAAALSFARRRQLPAGGMRLFLENFPGGLKAIVAAERRERRPEGTLPKPDLTRDRARALPGQAILTLPGDDEFVMLVARRTDGQRVAIIGVVPDDKAMLNRALRQIVDESDKAD